MPLGVGVRVLLSWGWSVRYPGLSAGGPSLPLPPPSTLVGALSRGIAKIVKQGEITEIKIGRKSLHASTTYVYARQLLAAGVRLAETSSIVGSAPNVVAAPTRVMQRILQHPYMRPENRKNMDMAFGVEAFGLVMAPSALMEILLVFKDQILDLVDRKTLLAGALSISYVGAKESLVTVLDAKVGNVSEMTGGETMYYAPLEAVKEKDRALGFAIPFWDPRDPSAYAPSRKLAKKMEFLIPTGSEGRITTLIIPPRVGVELKDNWRSYALNGYGTVASLGGD